MTFAAVCWKDKFGEKTLHDYIRHVEIFVSFLGLSLDTATRYT